MRYIPALDGLRALAVLAVVCLHAHVPWLQGGFIGVDVFFVLSGYLITQVLAANPDLPRFYWRRAKRLVPALAFMLAAYLIVAPLVVPDYPHSIDAGIGMLYLSDYANAFWFVPTYIPHLWSLSVEEHFYLLWPLIFLRWRPSGRVLLAAYLAVTVWRWWPGQVGHYFRFDTHSTGLILGCLIAQAPRLRLPAWPGLVCLAVLAAIPPGVDGWSQGPLLMAAELSAAFVILARSPAWLERPALTYLGKLSYGIYLWHFPIMRVLLPHSPWPQTLAIGLVASVAMAALSYHTIEALARRRKGLRQFNIVDMQQAGSRAD